MGRGRRPERSGLETRLGFPYETDLVGGSEGPAFFNFGLFTGSVVARAICFNTLPGVHAGGDAEAFDVHVWILSFSTTIGHDVALQLASR